MNLSKKVELISRTLGVGKARIVVNLERVNEIKEAITRQDIRDLVDSRAITIKNIKGTKKIVKRTKRRKAGSVRKRVNVRKQEYVIITRKLRAYIKELRNNEAITQDQYKLLRKEIKAKSFKSKAAIKERITHLKKQ